MDPWQNLTNAEEPVAPKPDVMNFEDNFEPNHLNQGPGLLPDSTEYLARLEQKLTKLKKGGDNAKSLVESLSAARQSCMIQLLSDGEPMLQELDQEICASRTQELILRRLAPHKQAISIEELVELLKADQLSCDEEKEKES